MNNKITATRIWNRIANEFNIQLVPQSHEDIIGILTEELESFANNKIDEFDKIMKQLSTSGTREIK